MLSDVNIKLRLTDDGIEGALSQLEDNADRYEIARHLANVATEKVASVLIIWLEKLGG